MNERKWYEEAVTCIAIVLLLLANELSREFAEIIAFAIIVFALASIRNGQR